MWPLAALDLWCGFHWLRQDSGGGSPSKTGIPEAVDGTGAYWVVLLAAPARLVEPALDSRCTLWNCLSEEKLEPVQLVELPLEQGAATGISED